jgi:hypothetical protein
MTEVDRPALAKRRATVVIQLCAAVQRDDLLDSRCARERVQQ